ncbi:MAG: c-type cytochrome [Pirellulales bacterium]|nr:c-type cytochrome [Pirellulales bacterium]
MSILTQLNLMNVFLRCFVALIVVFCHLRLEAETLRHPAGLQQQLEAADAVFLAAQARLRGNPKRGALVFYKSAAACVNCHSSGGERSPLGPDLAKLGRVTDQHVIESLLHPSKAIGEGYRTHSILTANGKVLTGLITKQDQRQISMRLASDLTEETTINLNLVEAVKANDQSLMPAGLVSSLRDQRDFFDLAAYVMEVAEGGPDRAAQLRPTPEQLAVKDDSVNLDHAGIIKKLRARDFEAGKGIYHGYCFNCHGRDGNTPSLPTARAFGTQKLKFGSDPYRMFMTLTRGNGLMAPMSHLTPKERYQVVHYIREAFMRPANPDYFEVNRDYLAGLPEGTEDGIEVEVVERDFGPALASQLQRQFSSVLTVKLGPMTISYDLHTLNQAGIWEGGFLDLSDTQHIRGRGEGTANPQGRMLPRLAGWQWGHDGTLDYSRDQWPARAPMPTEWMDYHGHHLHGDHLLLRYSIDGREVTELPRGGQPPHSVRHALRVESGKELILAVAAGPHNLSGAPRDTLRTVISLSGESEDSVHGAAGEVIAVTGAGQGQQLAEFTAAGVRGDVEGCTWQVDSRHRLCLKIPADSRTRELEIVLTAANGRKELAKFGTHLAELQRQPLDVDFETLTSGGPLLWPQRLTTVGYPGLEQGAYKLDTLTLPDSTPWNTWFRTSALDFFPDGRMVLATHGGDIWIVSGIDDELLNLQWKRFAGGLYEPFGVKVVDDHVYVTCKDRLTKLHDVDSNGEADFYESFSADQDVSVNFHAFNFDLQVDASGNFYYSKSGHGADSHIPGAIIKVSSDGKYREVYCTGFRTPNGMGILPDGRLTASDNQGQWTPASKVSLLKRGGFYGWVANYSIPGKWEPGGGTIDLNKVVPPKTFDQPLVWMPQEFDNSSGGQVWAGDSRWGPLSGRLLHTSFGKGWMYYMMIQDLDQASQAAIIKLPFHFQTGIMRARVNPADGQVYATGLQGWNGGGRLGLLDRGVQRLRYTGKPHKMVSDCRVEKDGLRLQFNFPLDPNSATQLSSYDVTHWNYHWRKAYGSEMYSPLTDQPGIEPVKVESVSLSADAKSVKLNLADLQPVNQVHLLIKVQDQQGNDFEEEIYWTINQVPKHP